MPPSRPFGGETFADAELWGDGAAPGACLPQVFLWTFQSAFLAVSGAVLRHGAFRAALESDLGRRLFATGAPGGHGALLLLGRGGWFAETGWVNKCELESVLDSLRRFEDLASLGGKVSR